MKKASVISIGNELLSGRTVDTNCAHLSERLLSISIPVVSSYVVRDEVEAIVRSLDLAVGEADVVLITGGLGPTDDDVTRQALAAFLKVELQFQGELLEKIMVFFARRGRQMAIKNKVQAYIPAGSKALANNLGTAPGIMAKVGEKLLFALPGVPSEMERMFEESVIPELRKLDVERVIVIRKLRCFGTGESNIAELLGDFGRRGRNPLINFTAGHGVITLHIVATAANEAQARRMAEKDEKQLRGMLGEFVYGTGEQTLAEVVGDKLARKGKTIAVAESCTGGLVSKLLTDVPGASRYLTHGWITYSNGAKISELGVASGLIEKHGAVSEEVAQAMARRAREKAGADAAIAVTGIAGPTGGREQKPVGLVYVSVEWDGGSDSKRFSFSGDREAIRLRTALTALNMLRLKI
jgi:nicotinamide-nucleotide amidase